MRFLFFITAIISIFAPAIAQSRMPSTGGALPDVYPSRRAAATAMAQQIGAGLAGDKDVTDSTRILVATAPESLNADDLRVVEEIATVLRRDWPKAEFAHSLLAQRNPTASDGLVISINVTHEAGVTDVQAQLPDRPGINARFVDKPWADDWTAYVNSDSNHRQLRGDSPRTALSQSEAEERACADAAIKLLPLVKSQMNRNAAGRASINISDAFVAGQTKELLLNSPLILDKFVQRYSRPYGNVWQASVLIDASPQRIDTIARTVSGQARIAYTEKLAADNRTVTYQRQTWGSLAAFLGVIVVLYWFLNAATKGYFTWRLRFGAVTLIILGVLAALFFVTVHMPRAVIVRP
jgi:hypothetical protein